MGKYFSYREKFTVRKNVQVKEIRFRIIGQF